MATGGVDVHVNGFGRVLGLEEEELGDDDVGGVVGDCAIDADDALLEEAGEDVVGSLASGGVLYNHRDQPVPASRRPSPWPPHAVRRRSRELRARDYAPHRLVVKMDRVRSRV